MLTDLRFDTDRGSVTFLCGDITYSGNLLKLTHGSDLLVHEAINVRGFNGPPAVVDHLRNSHVEVQKVGTVAQQADRVRSANVSFEVADVFSWDPGARFDVIFFSAWLSHVPMSRFDQFWQSLRGLLTADGRVLFIDEHVDERGKEAYVAGREEIVGRQLRDGSTFRVVKNFVDPEQLELRLRRLGWDSVIRRDGSDWVWVCGEARLAR